MSWPEHISSNALVDKKCVLFLFILWKESYSKSTIIIDFVPISGVKTSLIDTHTIEK